jgi:hypothetical protein
MSYVWCFLMQIGHGLEMTNHYVNADTETKHQQMLSSWWNISIITIFSDGQFIHNWPELAWFLKSKLTYYVGTLHTNRKNAPPPLKRIKQWREASTVVSIWDTGVHIWQDKKKGTMILMYHKDKMNYKVNKWETKLAAVWLQSEWTREQLISEIRCYKPTCLGERKVPSGKR